MHNAVGGCKNFAEVYRELEFATHLCETAKDSVDQAMVATAEPRTFMSGPHKTSVQDPTTQETVEKMNKVQILGQRQRLM